MNKQIKYTDDNPYIEDAHPCKNCKTIPVERIDKLSPFYICGIPIDSGYGTTLTCKCGNKIENSSIWRAYLEWNTTYGGT